MLDAAFDALKQLDWGADLAPLAPIDQAVVAAHDDPTVCADLQQRLVAILQSDAGLAAKDYVCRKLMLIGGAECVPALAANLSSDKLAHLARYALERIPTPEAAAALRGALNTLPSLLKIGVISSLGTRQDAGSVNDLGKLLQDADVQVARAAAHALGAIGSPAASQALSGAAAAGAKPAVTDATLACAEGFLKQGQKSAALALYKRLNGDDQPKHVQVAVKRGLLACVGK